MQMYGIIPFASELEIKHMIDGLGEIIPYFVCLHVTKNLVIAFFHNLSWDKKAADITQIWFCLFIFNSY